MTSPESVDVGALLDPRRRGASGPTVAGADGVFDLLPSGRGVAAASRRVYGAHPFDHRDAPAAPGAFERGLSPLARRLGTLLPRSGAVLEVGSGAGHMTTWLRSLGVPVVAVDQSRESLGRLRASCDAPAVAADATALPFRDAVFAAVLADGVLHHTSHPAGALREAVRVLRPDGLLFVRVYRAEARYPSVYRTVGGALRAADALPPLDRFVWRVAFPAYRAFADRRYRRRGEVPGRHDEGVFSDYFLTPRATPVRGSTLFGALRRLGLEVLAYERYRNVHGFLARKRGVRLA